jgi:hypothetical protein
VIGAGPGVRRSGITTPSHGFSVFRFQLKSWISVRELYFGGVAVAGRGASEAWVGDVAKRAGLRLWVAMGPPQWAHLIAVVGCCPSSPRLVSMGDGAVPGDLCSCKYDLIPYCPFGPLGNSPSRRPDRLDQESIWSMRSRFRSQTSGLCTV